MRLEEPRLSGFAWRDRRCVVDLPFKEYLYVDKDRIESYYEQLQISPKKVPVVGARIGLNPSASVSWKEQEADLATKVDSIQAALLEGGFLAFARPTEEDRWDLGRPRSDLPRTAQDELWAIFRQETVELRTVLVVADPERRVVPDGLTLWVAENQDAGHSEPDLLVLIEQFPLADELSAATASGHSLLSMVLDDMGLDGLSGIDSDPLDVLRKIGGRIGPAKMSTAFYRVRATYAEMDRGISLTTVGYPLAIWRS